MTKEGTNLMAIIFQSDEGNNWLTTFMGLFPISHVWYGMGEGMSFEFKTPLCN